MNMHTNTNKVSSGSSQRVSQSSTARKDSLKDRLRIDPEEDLDLVNHEKVIQNIIF